MKKYRSKVMKFWKFQWQAEYFAIRWSIWTVLVRSTGLMRKSLLDRTQGLDLSDQGIG